MSTRIQIFAQQAPQFLCYTRDALTSLSKLSEFKCRNSKVLLCYGLLAIFVIQHVKITYPAESVAELLLHNPK